MAGPCWDVYVWVGERPDLAAEFLLEHVDPADPGEDRLLPFRRLLIDGHPQAGDAALVAELRIDGADSGPATIYLKGREHVSVIVTHTVEGAFTLGLSVDEDPPDSEHEALALLASMSARYAAPGRAGVELAPAGNWAEWLEDDLVVHRVG